jgi:hypothetical protein
MSGKDKESEKRFIALYRLKVQRDLDAMSYPGGEEETAPHQRLQSRGIPQTSCLEVHFS